MRLRSGNTNTGAAHAATRDAKKLGSWEDLYRERWTWDHVARGTHGWLNCRKVRPWLPIAVARFA